MLQSVLALLDKVPESIIPAQMRVESLTHLALDWHSLRHSVRTLLDLSIVWPELQAVNRIANIHAQVD